jgi:Amt family ammonium transporter
VISTIAYTAVASLIILLIVSAVFGLRVTRDEEREGLDVVLHGEQLG